MDIAGVYLHMNFESSLAAMLCELLSEYKKYVMKDGRMMVKLEKPFYGCTESAKLWY